MNRFQSLVSLSLIGAAVLLAGCPKKPVRPTPNDTSITGPDMVNSGGALDAGLNDPSLQAKTADDVWGANVDREALAGNTVYFDFDRSAIKASERPKLQQVAKWLSAPENKGKRLGLEGHCDWRGTEEYNLGLGDRRANEVKNYLKSLGVPESQLDTRSRGDLGAKENAAETEMSKDRRVDIVVLLDGGAAPLPLPATPAKK